MFVVSAPGSAQMQIRLPSACTPLGPNTGEFNGVLPSCASTSAERIALQSVGRATGVDVGLGEGELVLGGELLAGDGVLVPVAEADVPAVPPPEDGGAVGVHAVSAATRLRAAAAIATLRVFMAQG
ncbi:hypothetical protein JCM13591A_07940 [Microbacterium xylanilyticum]